MRVACASSTSPSRPRRCTSRSRRGSNARDSDSSHRKWTVARRGGSHLSHAARLPPVRSRPHGLQRRVRRRGLRRLHRAARRQDDQLLHRAGGLRGRPRRHDRRRPSRGRAPPSCPASIHGRRRISVWGLHAWPGRGGQSAARRDPEPERHRDSGVDARQSLPLHGLLQDRRVDPGCRPAESSVNAFDYRGPRALDEALAILQEYGDEARVIAGGTALVTMMRQRLVHPRCVVSLRDVEGLGQIEARNGAVRLGALVTHREAETSPLLQERLPVLAETFRRVGTIRIRHMATVGGALAHADPNQDPPATLIALGARVEIQRAGGQRELAIEEFFRDYYEPALEPGELVTAVTVPLLPAASGASFVKFLPRTADDYATVAAAINVTLEPEGERCREARIALGSVATTPLRARDAEALLEGAGLDETLVKAVGEAAKRATDPLDDHRGSAAYKRTMTAVMVGRALAQAWQAARASARGAR